MRKILSLIGLGVIASSTIGTTTLSLNPATYWLDMRGYKAEQLKNMGTVENWYKFFKSNLLKVSVKKELFYNLFEPWHDELQKLDWLDELSPNLENLFHKKFELYNHGATDFEKNDFKVLADTFVNRFYDIKEAFYGKTNDECVTLSVYRDGEKSSIS